MIIADNHIGDEVAVLYASKNKNGAKLVLDSFARNSTSIDDNQIKNHSRNNNLSGPLTVPYYAEGGEDAY